VKDPDVLIAGVSFFTSLNGDFIPDEVSPGTFSVNSENLPI
jgi:hypothetical protein